MKKLIGASAMGLALCCAALAAEAATYSDDFLDETAVFVADGQAPPEYYYYFDGSTASQTYVASGLDEARSVNLGMNYQRHTLLEPITFTFSLNGTDIGEWTVSALVATEVANLTFDFAAIGANPGQSFTLALRVTDGVCSGCGSVGFDSSAPSSLTLSDVGAAVVPEPASWALMILGFGAAGSVLRRRGVPA